MSNVMFSNDEEKTWADASGGFDSERLPDGSYVATLANAKIIMIGQERKKKLCLEYELANKSLSIRAYKHFLPLDIPKMMWLTKKAVSMFGIDSKITLGTLESYLQDCIGAEVVFELGTNGKFQNAELISVTVLKDSAEKNDDLAF